MKIQFDTERLKIDKLKVTDDLAEVIKNKVVKSLEKQGVHNDVVITNIDLGQTNDVDSVELKVELLDVAETVYISFERSEFNLLHYINPKNIKFDTFKIDDVDIPDELFSVIKEQLVYELERFPYGRKDFRKCKEIRVLRIEKMDNYDCPDKINLMIEILYDCLLEGHVTPNMTEDVYLTFEKSELILKILD